MLAAFEILGGLFLIWYFILPTQNYEIVSWLCGGAFFLWAVAFLLKRSRTLLSPAVFFHFCLLVALHARVSSAAGWLAGWYIGILWVQWTIVLWFRYQEKHSAAAWLLVIVIISPLYWPILNVRNPSFVGLSFWTLATIHASWLSWKPRNIRIPKILLLFLFLSLLPVAFAIYPWRALQFFWIQCACVILYCVLRSLRKEQIQAVMIPAYLLLSFSLFMYVVSRDVFTIPRLGLSVLAMRHHILEHSNTLAPLYIIFSSILLFLSSITANRIIRILILSMLIALAGLEFLTYSRSGWIAYLFFIGSYGLLAGLSKRKITATVKKTAVLLLAGVLIVILLQPLRQMSFQRAKDKASVSYRIFSYKLGLHTILQHPFFGVGWFNYYSHAKLFPGLPLADLEMNMGLRDVHNHSLFLDIAEAGGIPLMLVFIGVLAAHFRRPFENKALMAGLIGVTVNNVLDTASLWLTVYPHLWILLALKKPGESEEIKHRSFIPFLLVVLLIASSVTRLVEDHYLQKGNFLHLLNRDGEAMPLLTRASAFAPLDVVPMEALRDVHLSRNDPASAVSTLERLMKLKKDYAPYHVQLGRIAMAGQDYARASKHLEIAQRLDPYSVLPENTYVVLTDLLVRQGSADYRVPLYRALTTKPGSMEPKAREILNTIPEKDFLIEVFQYMDRNSVTSSDRALAIEKLHESLRRLNKPALASRVLGLSLMWRDKLSPEDRDSSCYFLARDFAIDRNRAGLESLDSCASNWAVPFLNAYREMAQRNLPEAYRYLISSIHAQTYAEDSHLWELYWKTAGDEGNLRAHYEVLQRLPSYNFSASYRNEIARSFFREEKYQQAADEFHRLSYYDYSNPTPHWWQARTLWLANSVDAKKANDRLQRFMRVNPLLQHLYRSKIKASHIREVAIMRAGLQNELNGIQWKTVIYVHPTCRITLPSDMDLKSISGSVALSKDAWFLNTDGFIFSIRNLRDDLLFTLQIDPQNNVSDRRWVPFSWSGSAKPIVLMTSPGGTPDYDWAMLSIDRAE